MDRENARDLFARSGLTYRVITPGNMQRLRTLINERMIASGCMGGALRCRQRATVRKGYAELRCKTSYFDNREAVTFNTDGFIGFAGWAADENVRPILDGFSAWVKELAP